VDVSVPSFGGRVSAEPAVAVGGGGTEPTGGRDIVTAVWGES
jgi:hypothetical protein